MSTHASSPPPSGLVPRFGVFIGAVKRALGETFSLRQMRVDGNAVAVAPLFLRLFDHLTATQRRFAVLHARFVAGTLATAPRRSPAPRQAAEQASAEGAIAQGTIEGAKPEQKPARRAPAIPPGAVLLTEFGLRMFSHLQALLEDPEMREFLAAAPQAGRILRPLWRKLSPDVLPDILRLPPRPRKPRPPRPPKPPRPARPPAGSGPPRMRRVTLPDGTRSWEPTPCYPLGEKPPRLRRSRADQWPEPEPEAPRRLRPVPARQPPRPPNPERRLSDYNWIGRLFMR
ncbi:MAG: hypothetical protein J0H14_23665 [Alphaproteobacteria bacterium]|nr:hypothetical protein [Alphaproteobacteria bacterium]